jgi:hypothetical protein
MKAKCKKLYWDNPRTAATHGKNIVYRVGNWYDFKIDDIDNQYNVYIGYMSYMKFDVSRFSEYFHTEQEVREIEIDKILK